MNLNYCCSVCGKQNVKLWRPFAETELLICATCAEARQSTKYEVDQNGQITCTNTRKTDKLRINLADISQEYAKTTVIPAIPDAYGNFWCYTAYPCDKYDWWKNLPTR